MKKGVLLIILDGWGISPVLEGNATLAASTPFLFHLLGSYPSTTLAASGKEVGLSFGEMGNSEVGHLNLGTGRVAMQDLPRIDKAISDRSFFQNEALLSVLNHVKKNRSSLHLLGLVSAGGVHSHINHLFALLDLAALQKIKEVNIHMIADGRDTPEKVALEYLSKLEKKIKEKGVGKISSILGRYYVMDRDKRWERIEKAYKVLVEGEGEKAENPEQAIKQAYQRGETDEFVKPTLITGRSSTITDNDGLIFFNFRADRARQISEAITSPTFNQFERKKIPKNLFFVSFTSYGQEANPLIKVAFFAEKMENQLAALLENRGLSQIHLAETEKYPHVAYFFNGGIEEPFQKEERVLIPSPKVATYDLKPEMSAFLIVQKAVLLIKEYDFGVINFANPDMVGHTGNWQATIKALEVVDQCLSKVVQEGLKNEQKIIITADHGNAEQMKNPKTGQIDKEHTINPVFFILVDSERKEEEKTIQKEELLTKAVSKPRGLLADVAPTILELLGIEKPSSMTGLSLIESLS